MWVGVSTGSSMTIGLNLLDNGIGSFISVFCLVWIFSFLCLGDFSWFWLCVSHLSGTKQLGLFNLWQKHVSINQEKKLFNFECTS